MSAQTRHHPSRREADVVVVGGGPVGLATAALLARLGVRTLLVEQRPGAAAHPRARSINLRTTEIFRPWGILEDLRAVSLPEPWTRRLIYTETLARRELGRIDASTQGIVDGVALSPAPWLLSSQDQFEPVIRRYAETLAPLEMRWRTRAVDFEADDAGVTVTVEPADGGATERVRARWLVGADGAASAIRARLGIALEGRAGLATLVNCHFTADLRRYTDHRPAMLYWTAGDAPNVFQKIDMADRWLCQIGYDPSRHRPEDFDGPTSAEWIRRSVGDADLDVRVLDVIPWTMSSTVATGLAAGRVFLVGDAAHQLPPSGGFGMNTGIQDGHNLAWKLAFVLRGRARPGLLETYDAERRPVAAYNAARSLENSVAVGRIRRAAASGDDAEIAAALAGAARYGNWLGMDLGLAYERGCLIADGTEPPAVDDPVSDYAPTARPGHRAPHHWLQRGGRTLSTLDLFEDRFVLLAGPEGETWETAARELGDPALRVERIGSTLADADGQRPWHTRYGVDPDGAVLVRPDGHVAARWPVRGREPGPTLARALTRLLG